MTGLRGSSLSALALTGPMGRPAAVHLFFFVETCAASILSHPNQLPRIEYLQLTITKVMSPSVMAPVRIIIVLISVALLSCGTKTETIFRSGITHQIHFKKARSCSDYSGVTIVVGDREYAMSRHDNEMVFPLPEGRYTFIQYAHGYEVRRWVDEEVVKNTYFTLECISKVRKQSQPGDR